MFTSTFRNLEALRQYAARGESFHAVGGPIRLGSTAKRVDGGGTIAGQGDEVQRTVSGGSASRRAANDVIAVSGPGRSHRPILGHVAEIAALGVAAIGYALAILIAGSILALVLRLGLAAAAWTSGMLG